jgi:PLP dependent protein
MPTVSLFYMSASNPIASNIAAIRQQLPAQVRLIAVSKYTSIEQMRWAYEAGIRDFGESRVPEVAAKQEALADLPGICWHLIGHLQTNKARKAVQLFDWIHSVDSLRLLAQIDRVAGELGKRPAICLQVKILPDPDKYGWSVAEMHTDWPQIQNFTQVDLRGLMAIAPLGLTSSQLTDMFRAVARLRQQLSQQFQQELPELSMGMSDDYLLAVAAGSTMIRIGSKIFLKI